MSFPERLGYSECLPGSVELFALESVGLRLIKINTQPVFVCMVLLRSHQHQDLPIRTEIIPFNLQVLASVAHRKVQSLDS